MGKSVDANSRDARIGGHTINKNDVSNSRDVNKSRDFNNSRDVNNHRDAHNAGILTPAGAPTTTQMPELLEPQKQKICQQQ
jgi:hypothetical protein